MIWTETAVYFLACSAALWFAFGLYGKTLMYLGRKSKSAKAILGLLVYVAFACVVVSPMFMAEAFIDGVRATVTSNNLYFVYFLLLFGLAPVPGLLRFRRHYLSDLRALGYFTVRRSESDRP
jgi:hypothetical protein